MPGTKTQHFVPRFYLRHFADSTGKLHAFRQSPDGGNYFLSTPDNLCAENYLYEAGRRGFADNPEALHNVIESRLAFAEGQLSRAYELTIGCCEDGAFQGEKFLAGRHAVCLLAANMFIRHPLILGDERSKAEAIVEKVLAEGGITEQERLTLSQVGLDNDLEGVTEVAIMQTSLFSADPEIPINRIYNMLADKRMCVIEAPAGMGFITTSMPLAFKGISDDSYEFEEAYMPLSSKYAAHFTDYPNEPDIRRASIEDAVRYNTALLVLNGLWDTAMSGANVTLEVAVENWKMLSRPQLRQSDYFDGP